MTSAFFFSDKSHSAAGKPLTQWVYHHQFQECWSWRRQGPHDLDRPRVFREHHLAFRAVDVVARVELLGAVGRRRRVRRRNAHLHDRGSARGCRGSRRRRGSSQPLEESDRTAAPECRAPPCGLRAWGRGIPMRRRTGSSRSPGKGDCRSPHRRRRAAASASEGSVLHEFVTGSNASIARNAPTSCWVVTSPPAT